MIYWEAFGTGVQGLYKMLPSLIRLRVSVVQKLCLKEQLNDHNLCCYSDRNVDTR